LQVRSEERGDPPPGVGGGDLVVAAAEQLENLEGRET
jgi:hypothetical protein